MPVQQAVTILQDELQSTELPPPLPPPPPPVEPQLPEVQLAVQSQVPAELLHEPTALLPFTLPLQLPEFASEKLIPLPLTLPE